MIDDNDVVYLKPEKILNEEIVEFRRYAINPSKIILVVNGRRLLLDGHYLLDKLNTLMGNSHVEY